MRFISTRTHGVLDYLVGLALFAAPWILNFAQGGAETWVPVSVGAIILLQSLMTNYEFGAVRIISMTTHLAMDIIIGLFLAISPWLFNFDEYIYLPHLIVGAFIVFLGLFTHTYVGSTNYHKNRAHNYSHSQQSAYNQMGNKASDAVNRVKENVGTPTGNRFSDRDRIERERRERERITGNKGNTPENTEDTGTSNLV